MALTYDNKPIKWTNEGTPPSTNLKTNGFQAGYKPPAAVFNNQWHTTGECIDELQTKLSGVDDKKVDKVTGKSLIDENVSNALSLDGNYIKSNKGVQITNGSIYVSDVNGDVLSLKYDENVQQTELHFLSKKADETSVANRFNNLPIKSLEGQKVKPTPDTEVTANTGATIIGDVRNRVFNGTTVTSGNVAKGKYSTAMGFGTTAQGDMTTSMGYLSKARAAYSTTMGFNTITDGLSSVAMGDQTIASGKAAVAMGYNTTASAPYSTAMGYNTDASADGAIAMGFGTTAQGFYSTAMGYKNNALDYQSKIGHYAKDGTAAKNNGTIGDAFIIGNGSDTTTSNAFRVTYAGKAYGLSSYGSSGADYAEYFEWKDGNPDNEDRRGRFVTLDGEKIRFATSEDDYILGIVSANPCVEGDIQPDDWQGKYLTDVFGQRLTQTVHIPARYEEREVVDPETGETTTENVLVEEEHEAVQWVLNPDFDPEQEYVSREDRKEWSPVGMMGKLVVIDDGTCEVNGYCKAGVNGIATKANDGYRVMARIDDTHIRVLVR